MSKRILLTGSTGLIGSPTEELLINSGLKVFAVGREEDSEQFQFDLAKQPLLGNVTEDVDFVVHLAAVIPMNYRKEVHLVNQKIDDNVFAFVKDKKIPLIYASSASVYGSASERILMDEMTPCEPDTEYAKQKLESELWIQKNLDDFFILRITAPYFSSLRYKGVLNTFCEAALNDNEIVLFGTGERCQDFIHATDIANLIFNIIQNPENKSGVYNVGSGSPTSMKTVAKTILKSWGNVKNISYSSKPDTQEAFKARYNIDEVSSAFDWKAKIDLETGIRELLEFLRDK